MSQDFVDLKVPKSDYKDAPSLYAHGANEERQYTPDLDVVNESASPTSSRILGPVASTILWIEPIWIGLLTPFLLLPGQFVAELFQPFFVAALFFFWPIRLLLQRHFTPRTPINGLLAIIVILIPISLWISPHKDLSWIAAGYLCLGISIYAAIVNWPLTAKFPWLVGLGLSLLGLSLAAVGPSILNAAPSKIFDNPDLEAAVQVARQSAVETVNPNILAGGLVFVLPLVFALALQTNLIKGSQDELRDRMTSIILAIICGIATIGIGAILVLTQSRGAYVGAAASCWLVLLLRWPRLWYLWVLLLAGSIGTVSWLGLDQLLGQSRFDHSINSYEGRTEIWIRTAQSIFDFPLSGNGIGTFPETIPELYPYSYYNNRSQPHAHNTFLQVGTDLGIIGLAAFAGLIVGVIMMFNRVIQTQRGSLSSVNFGLAIGGIGAVMAMVVHGLFDSALWGTKLSALPWMLYGMAVVLPKEQSKQRRRRRRHRSE